MAYDDQNIFAKILRGEIPNNTVVETEHSLAFHDIAPQMPVHILVIPKGAYLSADDFFADASEAEIVDLCRTVSKVARDAGIAEDGYRLIANHGRNGHQEVPHFHVHIVGGGSTGPMLSRR